MSRFLDNMWNKITEPTVDWVIPKKPGTDDEYEVDPRVIREKKLTYLGRDLNGNKVWTDEAGHMYWAYDLGTPKTPEYSGGTRPSGGTVPNASWQDYAAGKPPSYMPDFTQKHYGNNPALQYNPTIPDVPIPKTPGINLPKPTNQSIPALTDPDYPGAPPDKGPCDFKGYFYIKDKDGNDPDMHAKRFFELLNVRAGGIWGLCPDGKVGLVPGADPNAVETNEEQSKLLALTVANAIGGGKGLNHAPGKHKVLLSVIPINTELCNKVFLDDYSSGLVDSSDYYMLAKLVSGSEGGNQNNDFRPPTITQAAFLGRLICERFATPNYETTKGANPLYAHYHQKGIERECDILKEMLEIPNNAFKNTRKEDFWQGTGHNADVCSHIFIYPKKEEKKDTHSLRIEVVCDARENNNNKWNKVLGSTLLVHSYMPTTTGFATGHNKAFSSF